VVTTDCVAPSGVIVFTTVTLQVTSYAFPVGKAGGLHCWTAGEVEATVANKGCVADVAIVVATPARITTRAIALSLDAPPDERPNRTGRADGRTEIIIPRLHRHLGPRSGAGLVLRTLAANVMPVRSTLFLLRSWPSGYSEDEILRVTDSEDL
jgi:hypothetical protein